MSNLNKLKKLRFKEFNYKAWLRQIWKNVVNFDIKPVKPIIPELLQQVDDAYAAGDLKLAYKIVKKLLAVNNANYDTLIRAIDLSVFFGFIKESERLLKHATKLYPQDVFLHEIFGYFYTMQGKKLASIKYYSRALELNPDSIEIRHILDGALGKNTVRAPNDYIVDLFDSYASTFEHSLLKRLSYKAPAEMILSLRRVLPMYTSIANVLDLGCGTGLMGQELSRHFNIQKLTGVDLSPKMLEFAKEKDIYHSLHNVDLVEYLRDLNTKVDLITCSDVLIYLGDLTSIFDHSYRVLSPGGYFVFSLEKLWLGDYKLTLTGRYQHSMRYIKSLYKRYQFSKMYSQTIDLRKECGNMVAGYLVLLQK